MSSARRQARRRLSRPRWCSAWASCARDNRQAYEQLRHDLRRAGVRVAELETEIDAICGRPKPGTSRGGGVVADLLADVDLFHTADGTAYVDVMILGHRETMPVGRSQFREYLTRSWYKQTGESPPSEQLTATIALAEAKAKVDGPTRDVFVRVAGLGGALCVDLGDAAWRAIEITSAGWRVVREPPVRFVRPSGYLALPEPARRGDVTQLKRHLNLAHEGDFVLVVAWLLAALRPTGPYPVLVLTGEQGTAKSTFTRLLKMLVDPNTVPLRAAPREERDLFIAATRSHVLAYDNLSGLPPALSDAFCRLATGGGVATRKLYTDQDEVLLAASRPTILNGISDFVRRGDLADRSVFLVLQPIGDFQRRPEDELLGEFGKDLPGILGALLDAMAHGLKNLPNVVLERAPRMADFAKWACACEGCVWPAGTFLKAYDRNRATAIEFSDRRRRRRLRHPLADVGAVGMDRHGGRAAENTGTRGRRRNAQEPSVAVDPRTPLELFAPCQTHVAVDRHRNRDVACGSRWHPHAPDHRHAIKRCGRVGVREQERISGVGRADASLPSGMEIARD